MLNVTQNAQTQVADFFAGKEIKPIRVFLNQGGCGGPQIAMAIDDQKTTDTVFTFAGIDYLVDTEFLKEAQPIVIDFQSSGFNISSSLKLEGCTSCGTEGSCCS